MVFGKKNKRVRSQAVKVKAAKRRRKSTRPAITLSASQQRLLKFFAISLIVLGAILWIRSWFVNPVHWPISKVEIKGDLKYVSRDELQGVIKHYVNTNLYLLDDQGLERDLEAIPWVKGVSLRKSLPQTLIITIKEYQAVAYWGEDHLLDQYGEIFNGSLPERRSDFPVLYSPEDKGREMGERYIQVLKWLKDVPMKVVSLTEDPRGSWIIRFEDGLILNVGKKEQEKRLRRFVVGYQKVLKKQMEKVSLVDLRYTNGFAVKWK